MKTPNRDSFDKIQSCFVAKACGNACSCFANTFRLSKYQYSLDKMNTFNQTFDFQRLRKKVLCMVTGGGASIYIYI